MTKPALFYTLRRKWHVGGFEVIRVTTVKRHRQTGSPTHYYGTDDTGGNTHCRADQCVGEFPTEDAARVMIDRVKRVREQHEYNITVLQAAARQAERDEREAIEAVIGGVEPMPPVTPISLTNRAQAAGLEKCKRLVTYG